MHNAGFGWERKQRASHYAAELEARAGGKAALSAADLTPGAPLERRRSSPLESTQILLHLTRRGNEQGPPLFAAHSVVSLSLAPGRLPHSRSHTLVAAASCQRSITATAGESQDLAGLQTCVSSLASFQLCAEQSSPLAASP